MLAMSKRLFVMRTDLTKAAGNLNQFKAKIKQWSDFMQNFGIKVIGQGEEINLHDTSLAELDAVIMNQYQLVAAAAHVPATKLLGTSPKGFNATGDYEVDSYHEFLETIQDEALSPIVDRHTTLCQLSEGIAKGVMFKTTWNPVAVLSAKEQADVNKVKADTDVAYAGIGALDGLDVRTRLAADNDSGYNGIPEIVPGGPGDRDTMQEEDKDADGDGADPKDKSAS
jgi:phage-related protein (TIGR01555 family)